jgi:hypothetical protein
MHTEVQFRPLVGGTVRITTVPLRTRHTADGRERQNVRGAKLAASSPGHHQLGIATTLPLLRQNGRTHNSFKLLGLVGSCLLRGMLTNLHQSGSSRNAQRLR